MRLRDRIRGRYYGGGMVVTSKHWWSPKARKSARLAAKLCVHMKPRVDAEMRQRLHRHLFYGDPL